MKDAARLVHANGLVNFSMKLIHQHDPHSAVQSGQGQSGPRRGRVMRKAAVNSIIESTDKGVQIEL